MKAIRRKMRAARTPSLALVSLGVLIPNAPMITLAAAGIGTPPRSAAILAFLVVALLARHLPITITLALYVTVLCFDLVSTISLLFQLSIFEIAAALRFAGEVGFFASPLYIAIAVAVLATTALAVALAVRGRDALRQAHIVPAILGAFALAALDLSLNTSPHFHFGSAFAAGRPFESAALTSGFDTAIRRGGGRNVLLILVEGLGAFADPAQQRLLEARFARSDIRSGYDVATGTTAYFGSTTAAEMRELCRTRESYTRLLLSGPVPSCLPAEKRAAGYETIALHGYSGRMFDRRSWWTRVGFEHLFFARELRSALQRTCGGVFQGVCDSDVAAHLPELVGSSDKSRFIYWVTLNTHVPVRPAEGTPRLGCDRGGPFDHSEVCYMTEMWLDVLDAVAALALDQRLQPVDVLVVGDHAPPLWSRRARGLFRPGEVTWFRLSPHARD